MCKVLLYSAVAVAYVADDFHKNAAYTYRWPHSQPVIAAWAVAPSLGSTAPKHPGHPRTQ